MRLLIKNTKRLLKKTLSDSIWLCLILGSTALGFVLTSMYFEKSTVRLEASLLSGRTLLYLSIAIVFSLVTKIGFGSGGNRDRNRRMISGVFSIIYALLVGSMTCALLLASYHPTDGSRTYILIDTTQDSNSSNPNDSVWAVGCLHKLIELKKTTDSAGRETIWDSDEIKAIVQHATGFYEQNPPDTQAIQKLALEFDAKVKRLRDIKGRLSEVDKETQNRKYDCVCVVSPSRNPKSDMKWPLDISRIHCHWFTISLDQQPLDTAAKPEIVHFTITQGVAIESLMELDMTVPSPYEFPVLRILLYLGDVLVKELTVNPPKRTDAHQSFPESEGVHFGRAGDRMAYKVSLPRLGDRLKIEFEGSVWGDLEYQKENLVPDPITHEFSANRIVPLDWSQSGFGQIPTFYVNSTVDNPAPIANAGDGGNSRVITGQTLTIVRGPITDLSTIGHAHVLEIIEQPPTGEKMKLFRSHAYYGGLNGNVWVPQESTEFPNFGIKLPSDCPNPQIFVKSSPSSPAEGYAVVFQRNVDRPGHVTLVVPPLNTWNTWKEDSKGQFETLRYLLLYAAELAESQGQYRDNVLTRYFALDPKLHSPPPETGKPSERSALGWQLLRALFYRKLDGHRSNDRLPENTITGSLLGFSMRGLFLLVMMPLILNLVRLFRGKSRKFS